jgi:tellurium resistance protein TerD
MAFNLEKGGNFNLTKEEPALKKIMVGLGWDTGINVMDLDVSVFMLGSNRKLVGDPYLIFYNNLKSPDGAVQHTGDNRSGEGEGDDEMILANLEILNPKVEELLFVVTIHQAAQKSQHFGLIKNAFIRLYDVNSKREVLKYNLSADTGNNHSIEFAKLKKVNSEWNFQAVGDFSNKGLEGYINIYA